LSSYSAFERTLGDRLGGGGQGEIFRIENTNFAYKRYTDPSRVEVSSLNGLMSWYKSLPRADQARVEQSLAWPTEIKYRDDGQLAGFVMPIAPSQAFVKRPVGTSTKNTLLELGMLMDDMRPAYKAWLPEIDANQRLTVIINFLELMDWLHKNGLVLGDISGRNFAWRPDTMDVFCMDCDAFLQLGKRPASPQLETPAFKDPDPMQPVVAGESKPDSDNFKIALVVMRLVTQMMNLVPNGADVLPAAAENRLLGFEAGIGVNHLEWRIKDLWKQAGKGGGLRPSPAEWLAAFKNERIMISVTPPTPLDPSAPRPRRPRQFRDL